MGTKKRRKAGHSVNPEAENGRPRDGRTVIEESDHKRARVKGLLQKINFIETDMELQKQILAAIPSGDRAEMEAVIRTIADQKRQIIDLRLDIKQIDEAEYDRIIAIEQAAETFRRIAADKTFVEVRTLNESGTCSLMFIDDTRLDCLVTAREENGDWTVLTLDGETREYPSGWVKQEV